MCLAKLATTTTTTGSFSQKAPTNTTCEWSHFSTIFEQLALCCILVFSRRFSREEPTIVKAFRQCFLRPPELTKIVLPKVLQNFQKTLKCTCWPNQLNQKGFPRNIQYRTRPKGPPFRFCWHCATFFKKKFPTEGSPFNFFWSCATEWMLKNPKGSSLSVFSAL